MPRGTLMTLLTDFGSRDPYVAAMKGTILGICPRAQIVDITHEVAPQDILQAAFIMAQSCPNFPPDTLHVVVVDPTVGTSRTLLAGRFGGQYFLFPDNGVISFIAQALPLEALHAVRNTAYLPAISPSMTFHGRDVFAPLAAQILNGLDISRLGPQPDRYTLLDLPIPNLSNGALVGRIVHEDRFGNLISNLSRKTLINFCHDLDRLSVEFAGTTIGTLRGAYAFAGSQKPLALINSMELLEVAINQGSAAKFFRAGVNSEIVVRQT